MDIDEQPSIANSFDLHFCMSHSHLCSKVQKREAEMHAGKLCYIKVRGGVSEGEGPKEKAWSS